MSKREVVIPAALALTLAGVIAAGGIAGGQIDSRVEDLERRVTKQETVQETVNEISGGVGILGAKVEALGEKVETYQQSTGQQLKRILDKLDRMGRPN